MSSRLAIFLTLAIGSNFFVSSHALADPVVVAIEEPDIPTWEAVQSAVQAKLRELGWQPTDEGLSGADLAQCFRDNDDECVRDLVAELPAPVVLLLRLRHSKDREGEPRVEIRGQLLDRATGTEVVGDQRYCERCLSLDRLLPLVTDLVESIIHERVSQLAPDTNVTIHSTPPQARVMIDGVVLGPSGTSYAVSPGPHTIQLDLDGYQSASRKVQLKPNQSQTLRIQLVPLEITRPIKPPSPAKYRVWKWVCFGSGVAALALGTTWVVMAQPSVDGGAEQAHSRAGRLPGYLTLGTGAALLGAGALMWRSDRREARRLKISASPVIRGAIVIVGGGF